MRRDDIWLTSSYGSAAERLLNNARMSEEDELISNWGHFRPIGNLAEGSADITVQFDYDRSTTIGDIIEQLSSEYRNLAVDYGVTTNQFMSSLNSAWASVDENWELREEDECSKEDPISYDDLMAEFED